MQEYDRLLRRFSDEYEIVSRVPDTLDAIRREVRTFRENQFPNEQVLDHESYLGRVYSSSYVVHGVSLQEEFKGALEALFVKHAKEGRVLFSYDAVAIAWPRHR